MLRIATSAIAIWFLLGNASCLPGRCAGGFRALYSPSAAQQGGSTPTVVPASAMFLLNADSSAETTDELLQESGVSGDSFFLEGPDGQVEAEIEAERHESAHSCASAATFSLRPTAPLAPGAYTLVLLVDTTRWPAVGGAEPETWQGHRALVQRYRVE